ncbi:ribokinase [Candidatus Mycoplasma pogonae]
MQSKILVVGSVNVDQVLQMKNFPKNGETIYSSNKKTFLGGKGSNQAIALKKLNATVDFIGKVGKDQEANFALTELQKHGIDINHIEQTNNVTGIASIYVSANGENTIVLMPGANHDFVNQDWNKWVEIIKPYDYLLFQLEINHEFVFDLIQLAKQYGKKVILNPAPAKKIPDEILQLCDYIIPNETELATIFDREPVGSEEEIHQLLLETQKTHPHTNLIVTFGAKGVYYINSEKQLVNVPAKKNVNVVDTTGAGDSFIGGFLSQISLGSTLEEAIKFGISAASISITRQGAATSIPIYEEVIKNV